MLIAVTDPIRILLLHHRFNSYRLNFFLQPPVVILPDQGVQWKPEAEILVSGSGGGQHCASIKLSAISSLKPRASLRASYCHEPSKLFMRLTHSNRIKQVDF